MARIARHLRCNFLWLVAKPDIDYLIQVLVVSVSLCLFTFSAGHLLAKLFRLDHSSRVALLYGLACGIRVLGWC
ncbi:hypothetical protein [Planctomycetes bacterium TBK1r]|uniref:Uncharacterized protein n=1 Tax=Stieleria magnilauensis TaxID=2527963 RepID=A0ABX5XUY3_9BACT|nr:hypothetical protein TBK1r_48590 [Planctomycetes bacterium TBK1r]